MPNERREFLKNLGLGGVGVSVLGAPASALAFGRRRRVECGTDSEPRIYRPAYTSGGDVRISHPHPVGTGIQTVGLYGGVFYFHGWWVNGVTNFSYQFLNGAGSAMPHTMTDMTAAMGSPWKWFYKITNLAVGTPFEIKVTFKKDGVGIPDFPTVGWFQLSNSFD